MPSLFLTSGGKGKRIVLWTLACFAVSQLVLSLFLDKQYLEMRDPLYGFRLRALQSRLAESPSAPLFLLLGSSRVKYSVLPGAMKLQAVDNAPHPIVYNFGINGMGAIRELMYFHRLLADGIRPHWLMLEVWPPLWAETGFFRESRMVEGEDDLHWRDVPLVCRFFRRDADVLRMVMRRCFVPISDYRTRLLGLFYRPLLTPLQLEEMSLCVRECLPDDRGGWFPLPWETTTPEAKRNAMRDGDEKIRPLVQPVRIDPRYDAALREILDECRQRGIKTALILMPEPSPTRGWYAAPSLAVVRDYLTRLRRDYSVPVVDTRAWVDDDDFSDSCHMSQKGVPAYSERLGREVVQPLISNRPLANNVLLAEPCPSESRP
ncbi:MAG: hypothetical protein ACYC3I_02920 [Gemmataceae bacterium]